MMPKRVVVWGHPLHSHTHSYVHAAFVKAFKALEYETLWLKDGDDVSGLDLSDTLFLTEGQVDGKMPRRKDCFYVLHNCRPGPYVDIPANNKLILQVFTNTCLRHSPEKVGHCAYYLPGCLFQPWATDLLPHEIDQADAEALRSKSSHWVGTLGGGRFGNVNEVNGFRRACDEHGVKFVQHGGVGFDDNRRLVRESWLAPSIHGTWQAENEYVACRVFKNISYGAVGVTNCSRAVEFMDGEMVCDKDTYAMANKAVSLRDAVELTKRQMRIVRDKHTYVNRVKMILSVIGLGD